MRLFDQRVLRATFVTLLAVLVISADVAHATVVTLQVGSQEDDYKESQSGASTKPDTTFDLWTTNDLYEAFRFVNVSIPPGAVISSAYLQLYSPATGAGNNLFGTARGEAVGNAPSWTGATLEISAAPKTTASVSISSLPTWTANTHNTIADVATIVQEIVNRCDWVEGNALKIFLLASSTSTHRRSLTYDSAPTRAAKLVVTWSWAPTTCNGRTVELATLDGTLTSIDLGWTGLGHDNVSFAREAVLSGTLSSCDSSTPPCGSCDITGPVQNTCADNGQISDRRCVNNTRTKCTSNADCGAGNTCAYYFGSYVPVPGLPFCVGNQLSDSMTGAVDLDNGDAAVSIPLATTFALGYCPTCVGDTKHNDGVRGGTCSGGPNAGLSCDVNGAGNPHLGGTSLDCPGTPVVTRQNTLDASTTSVTATLSTSNPSCTAVAGKRCFCSTCNNANAQPCFTSSDCPQNPSGTAGICGGRRCLSGGNSGAPCTTASQCPGGTCGVPGEPTKPNACIDDTSTVGIDESNCATIDGEGVCSAGPADTHCSTATYQGCSTNAQCTTFRTCSNNSARTCTTGTVLVDCGAGATCVTDTCITDSRKCYLDNGVVGNSVTAVGTTATPSNDQWDTTLANEFVCVGPVVGSFDSATGLPGLSRVELPVRVRVRP